MTETSACLPTCREGLDEDYDPVTVHADGCPKLKPTPERGEAKVKHDGWSCGCGNKLSCELAEEAQRKATPAEPVKKGGCVKIPHTGTGYLHSEDDDSPFDIDGNPDHYWSLAFPKRALRWSFQAETLEELAALMRSLPDPNDPPAEAASESERREK